MAAAIIFSAVVWSNVVADLKVAIPPAIPPITIVVSAAFILFAKTLVPVMPNILSALIIANPKPMPNISLDTIKWFGSISCSRFDCPHLQLKCISQKMIP